MRTIQTLSTLMTVVTLGTASCGGGETRGDEVNGAALVQYTPEQAKWSTFATKPRDAGLMAHDPDSVSWIKPADWEAAKWDGTIYNPSKMSPKDFVQAICPSVDRVRGIREVFYASRPFADNANPTKAEVDEWHRIAINHVRALVGYTSPDRRVEKDHCMFARALWGDERKFTTAWDSKYPGINGSSAGPCQGSSNGHCGATFLPSAEEQAPYLPSGHPVCNADPGSEGVFSGPKSNIPWSIKWSRGFCNTLIAEGYWGGHVGPWFHRQKFGLASGITTLATTTTTRSCARSGPGICCPICTAIQRIQTVSPDPSSPALDQASQS